MFSGECMTIDGLGERVPDLKPREPADSLRDLLDTTLPQLREPGYETTGVLLSYDALYDGNDKHEAMTALVHATALKLLKDQSAFDNLNFHSSLVDKTSTFFGAVLREMGEIVAVSPGEYPELAVPVQIRMVEHYRRDGKKYDLMEESVRKVEEALRDVHADNQKIAWSQLGAIRYEQAMAWGDRKDFAKAQQFALISERYCERAENIHGILAARGIRLGMFAYLHAGELNLSDRSEREYFDALITSGLHTLKCDFLIAQKKLEGFTPGSPWHKIFSRVASNNLGHLIEMAAMGDDKVLGNWAFDLLCKNSFYLENQGKNPDNRYVQLIKKLNAQAA